MRRLRLFGLCAQHRRAAVLGFLSLWMLLAVPALLAQEATPEPITIPTDVLLSQTNSWIDQLAPITAIGVGIAIAIAILAYVGKQILNAFRS